MAREWILNVAENNVIFFDILRSVLHMMNAINNKFQNKVFINDDGFGDIRFCH